jgi:predicted nucleic acid-binding protein
MSGYLLDTSALLALRDNEPGADRVAELLGAAADGGPACHGCFMTLMEVLYRVWKDEGKKAGRTAYAGCQRLAISWQHENAALLERAAEIKARFPVSLADAWIAAAAQELDAVLVHKDPEFERIDGLRQEVLPYK